MDNTNTVLKKKLSTFRSEKGSLINITPEVLFEVLRAWESWVGTSKDFYRSIGVSQAQMAVLIGKAKKTQREGGFPAEAFKEIKIESPSSSSTLSGSSCCIELAWEAGKLIRFSEVSQLVDFLKKVA